MSDRPQAEEEQEEKRPWGHHKERGGEHTLQEPPSRVGFKPRAAAVMPKVMMALKLPEEERRLYRASVCHFGA